ncbi:MAG TPA: tetratricopeptide repeat protein, partial [Chitinophagaceae bacterium]|nr:tetratricopeptide repeat protein [Chitinophagaceae bacterium]
MRLFLLLLVCATYSLQAQKNTDFENALRYIEKENYTEAVRLLKKAQATEPENETIQKELANALYLKRTYFEAIPMYEKLLGQEEDNIQYLCRLSEMYSMSPQKFKSVEYAERAIRLKPVDGNYNRMLARSFQEVQHYPKAIELYKKAEHALPDDKDIPFQLATCYSQLSDASQASKWYERALELDPGNPSKLFAAANAAYDMNQFSKACAWYQQAEDKGYFRTTGFYINWANACMELKEFDKALFYLFKAKEFAPYDRELKFAIADAYSSKGDFENCRNTLDEILEINANDAEAIYAKGMSYYKAGKQNKAEPY